MNATELLAKDLRGMGLHCAARMIERGQRDDADAILDDFRAHAGDNARRIVTIYELAIGAWNDGRDAAIEAAWEVWERYYDHENGSTGTGEVTGDADTALRVLRAMLRGEGWGLYVDDNVACESLSTTEQDGDGDRDCGSKTYLRRPGSPGGPMVYQLFDPNAGEHAAERRAQRGALDAEWTSAARSKGP
jgi:hypothetical protein